MGRVVIDARCGEPLWVYVAMAGNEDLLKVGIPSAEGVELVCLGNSREE